MQQPTNIAPTLNMSGCTINITFNQAPSPPPPLPAITPEELDQILEG